MLEMSSGLGEGDVDIESPFWLVNLNDYMCSHKNFKGVPGDRLNAFCPIFYYRAL